jgi:hypothetical protein
MSNLDAWNKLKTPPPEAMSKIKGGRLNGMTDIKPQWRYKVMTEVFGPVGLGWGYSIKRLWTEKCEDGTVCAFAEVSAWYKLDGAKSELFDGIGGSMLVAKESAGLRTSDECYKMATTDALSVALKMIGVGADVYSGDVSHDSKYAVQPEKQCQNKHEDSSDKNKKAAADFAQKLDNAVSIEGVIAIRKAAEAAWNNWPEAWIDKLKAKADAREEEFKAAQ